MYVQVTSLFKLHRDSSQIGLNLSTDVCLDMTRIPILNVMTGTKGVYVY